MFNKLPTWRKNKNQLKLNFPMRPFPFMLMQFSIYVDASFQLCWCDFPLILMLSFRFCWCWVNMMQFSGCEEVSGSFLILALTDVTFEWMSLAWPLFHLFLYRSFSFASLTWNHFRLVFRSLSVITSRGALQPLFSELIFWPATDKNIDTFSVWPGKNISVWPAKNILLSDLPNPFFARANSKNANCVQSMQLQVSDWDLDKMTSTTTSTICYNLMQVFTTLGTQGCGFIRSEGSPASSLGETKSPCLQFSIPNVIVVVVYFLWLLTNSQWSI